MYQLIVWLGNACYLALALDALWGVFWYIMVWRRVASARMKNEDTQNQFLDTVENSLAQGDLDAFKQSCDTSPGALPQLVSLTVDQRELGYLKVRDMVADRFRKDVMQEIEKGVSWVNSVIKSAPMLGLLGTVLGMMGAFYQLGHGEGGNVDPAQLATDIQVALYTTFLGLSIAIPLTLMMTGLNLRCRRMEEQVSEGLARFLEYIKGFFEPVGT